MDIQSKKKIVAWLVDDHKHKPFATETMDENVLNAWRENGCDIMPLVISSPESELVERAFRNVMSVVTNCMTAQEAINIADDVAILRHALVGAPGREI